MLNDSFGGGSGKKATLAVIAVTLIILIAGTVLVYRGDVIILIPGLQKLDRGRDAAFDPGFLSEEDENLYVAKMYFVSADGKSFVQEERTIRGGQTINGGAVGVLSELIRGPASAANVALLPPSLKVREVYIDDQGIAYVDFGKELTEKPWGDTDWAISVLHSLVKTLSANFPQIKRVQILVDGEDLESFLQVDTSRPLSERDFVAGQIGRTQGSAPTNPAER